MKTISCTGISIAELQTAETLGTGTVAITGGTSSGPDIPDYSTDSSATINAAQLFEVGFKVGLSENIDASVLFWTGQPLFDNTQHDFGARFSVKERLTEKHDKNQFALIQNAWFYTGKNKNENLLFAKWTSFDISGFGIGFIYSHPIDNPFEGFNVSLPGILNISSINAVYAGSKYQR